MNRVKPSFWLFLINRSKLGFGLLLSVLVIPLSVFDIILFNSDRLKSSPDANFYSCATVVFALLILEYGVIWFSEWRKFQEFSLIFKNGLETIGEITIVYLAARKLYITIKYVYQQEERFTTKEIPLQSRNIKNLAVGQKATLYINPQYPTDIVFRDLYVNAF